MSMRPKERAKKSEEMIEESGGNIRGFWLNHDREEWTAIAELKGAEHEWSFWEDLETEED
jgi:general stress protein YciG